ncbi:hypothetical protein [Amycolatopsis viridis]|uniref:Histidine kinase n=1 Tax=Amycolatopsis viridis TaxID=185678 RepID=A0ABX0SWC5_9PSEU|nr:hypothetical protein [Amycolatopsis viridis]NIH80833.1 hypothetical protein [Amycolatopsis viridis]
MDLTPYVDNLRHELVVAAEAGGEDVRTLAERLIAPLESAARLTFLNILSAAADEITRDVAPGSVDLRLRGLDPSFVVTLPPETSLEDAGERGSGEPGSGTAAPAPASAEDGATARINFRPPEQLKTRIEEAAAREGLSVNAWLVRAVSATLQSGARAPERRASRAGQRFSGWVH